MVNSTLLRLQPLVIGVEFVSVPVSSGREISPAVGLAVLVGRSLEFAAELIGRFIGSVAGVLYIHQIVVGARIVRPQLVCEVRELSRHGLGIESVVPAVVFKPVQAAAHPLTESVGSSPASGAGMEIGLVTDIGHDPAGGGCIESQCIRQIEERVFLIALRLGRKCRRKRRDGDHHGCDPCCYILTDSGDNRLFHNNSFSHLRCLNGFIFRQDETQNNYKD